MDARHVPLDGRTLLLPTLGLAAASTLAMYAVLFDQGALLTLTTTVSSGSAGVLHEFFHDARHLLGVPCH